MNFQVTVLKILVSYPGGFAAMDDLKRDMALLATSGRDWSDRTQGHVVRGHGGWRITDKGRAVLDLMEVRPAADEQVEATAADPSGEAITASRLPAERARRRRARRERKRAAAEQARAAAS